MKKKLIQAFALVTIISTVKLAYDFNQFYKLETTHYEIVSKPIMTTKQDTKDDKTNSKEVEIIFNQEDLREPSNLTYKTLYPLLTQMTGGSMKDLTTDILDAQDIYNVNAFALLGIIALESDWNRSQRAIQDNNLTGMAVYNDNSKGYKYKTKKDCIYDLAMQLDKYYLTPGAKHYNGMGQALTV